MAAQSLTVALAGNPNVGKSTLFNALTGSRQHVGNWPGKTVEKKQGRLKIGECNVEVVDLPGTYSLTTYSVEERIARDYLLDEAVDVVVAVVDSSNLERNLYLVTQFMEIELPIILVLNMSDMALNRGIRIDGRRLSEAFGGIPVVETVGSRGIGMDRLKSTIAAVASKQPAASTTVDYGAAVRPELDLLESVIARNPPLAGKGSPRWLALKLLENDSAVIAAVEAGGRQDILQAAGASGARIEAAVGEDAETLIADARYTFIAAAVKSAVTRPSAFNLTRSDRLDRVLTHRVWGLPIFLLLMWLVFQFTANVSAPYSDWIDGAINGPFARGIQGLLIAVGLQGTWVESLVLDGIVAGVGGVLVFVPILLVLYLAIALLEDSGYMARAAFVMDRLMRVLGLHGKSFLPLLIGFGCTVPAVYATRTLENEKDRRLTAFIATFMSCGARLPVYAVFGAAFFGAAAGNLIFALYVLGIFIALVTGIVAKRTIYRSATPPPFVMELPPYRAPTLRNVTTHVWERTSAFVRKASTVILSCSLLIWVLLAIPVSSGAGFNAVPPRDSLFGAVSGAIAPVFAPAGFGNWESTGALLTGIIAKEVVISSMNQIFVGESPEADAAANPPTFGEDVSEVFVSFGEASVLTLQEVVNIVPRTVNLVPFIHMPEAEFVAAEAEADDATGLASALTGSFTPLAAVAFNIFILLYVPCMAATSALRHEFGTRMMFYQMGYTLAIAWLAAVVVFQVGSLLNMGGG